MCVIRVSESGIALVDLCSRVFVSPSSITWYLTKGGDALTAGKMTVGSAGASLNEPHSRTTTIGPQISDDLF